MVESHAIEFTDEGVHYRIRGKDVFVMGFGTTGPNQRPHHSWLSIREGTETYALALKLKRQL